MNVGFVVNDIATEEEIYTTTQLAMAATNRGHEVRYMDASDLVSEPDDRLPARTHSVPGSGYDTTRAYLADLQGPDAVQEVFPLEALDVLMLRSDPSLERGERAWAQEVGIFFGRFARRRGVIVLNDPDGLAKAYNKMYLQLFPPGVRPRTLIARNRDRLMSFVKELSGGAILKPLMGSGGRNVFLVRPGDEANLRQMIDAVGRDGYVVVQEYLPAIEEGDVRVFMMNGDPLHAEGRIAAFRRLRSGGNARTNISAGGQVAPVEIDERILRVCHTARPLLLRHGMFFVGLDIVGDKLLEVNVCSPAGLECAAEVQGVEFEGTVIDALERKVEYARQHGRQFDNVAIATL